MKRFTAAAVAAVVLVVSAGSAFADVSRISIAFKGGCVKGNKGTCVIRASAKGTGGIQLYSSSSKSGPFTLVSPQVRGVSDGHTDFRFANRDGCFQARNKRNGDSNADHASNVICE